MKRLESKTNEPFFGGSIEGLTLRSAEESDCRNIYDWRMSQEARASSRETGEISYEEHINWFKHSLKNPNRIIYMALTGNEKVGQIRFDMEKEKNMAEISITINPEKYGRGYGTEIIKRGIDRFVGEYPSIKKLRAEIKPQNISSIKVFERNKFKRIGEKKDRHNQIFWTFTLSY